MARGAFSVVLAYAFLLQVIVAGLAAERMTFAAMDSGAQILCASGQGDSSHGPGQPDADHSACCALCAFSSVSPLVPVAATAGAPVAVPGPAIHSRNEARPEPGLDRHEPRTSQGPPPNA